MSWQRKKTPRRELDRSEAAINASFDIEQLQIHIKNLGSAELRELGSLPQRAPSFD
jgi:hypothetical protein